MTKPVALVTGASLGIGAQFCRILAERGNDLVLVARDAARLEALAKELEAKHGNRCEVLAADLTVTDELARVEARAGTVDTLINNAGFGSFGKFHELDLQNEDTQIRLNVLALVRLSHAAARGMVERGHGAILNVASLAGFQPIPTDATYAATKAFVLSLSEAVHEELKGTGVTMTAVCPGPVKTEFMEAAGIEAAEDQVPGLFWMSADDVARAAVEAADKGKRAVVPGLLNRAGAITGQHTPRTLVLPLAKRVWRQAV
jgi:hypothetical protein